MKTLIIGRGEVGNALVKVLAPYSPDTLDKLDVAQDKASLASTYEIMHICFPYSGDFKGEVMEYQAHYKPIFTVIHSTVPVGTSSSLRAIHSPVRGIHPFLEQGLRTFVKFIGGPEASKVADYFRRAGLRIMLFDRQEVTELAKLLETESYRANIEFAKYAKQQADFYGVSYHEAYTLQALSYNEAYQRLGYPEFTRPVLQAIDGPIGGHCVMANKELIGAS